MTQGVSARLEIASVCDQIKELLLEKNAKYGNSALEPVRVFSKDTAVNQLLVRIDDKLSRIKRGVGLLASDEDVINDLIGYLVLLKIALNKEQSISFDYSEVQNFFQVSDDLDYQTLYGGTDI